MKAKTASPANIAEALLPLAVPIASVKPDPRNARLHPQPNLDALKRSLQAYGQRKPIVVNAETGIIEAGNGLWQAAKELGWTEIAVLLVKDSPESAQGYSLMDNQSALLSEWDLPALKDILQELDTGAFDMALTGFDEKSIEELMTQFHVPAEGLTDDDEIPDQAEAICKSGELWELGNHRLLCGDATKREDVERLMGGEKADMLYADPPYGMKLNTDYSKSHKYGQKYPTVIGDFEMFDPQFVLTYFKECQEIFLWGGDYYCWRLPQNGSWFVWDKLSTKEYVNSGGDNEFAKKRIGNSFELCWSREKHKRLIYYCFFTNTFSESKDDLGGNHNTVQRYHPTQKPIKLFQDMIKDWSKENWLILDPFGGSGTTLIACEKLGRRCFMMEIEPHYCDVIIERWQNYTGKKAVKVS